MRQSLSRSVVALFAAYVLAGCSDETVPNTDAGPDTGIVPNDTGGRDTGPAIDVGPHDSGPQVDTGTHVDTGVAMHCGNSMIEGTETCDDGNTTANDGCSATCELECGDGTVSGAEMCDTAITTGTGACPTTCDDAMACTTDTVAGTDCEAHCVHGAITMAMAGDGCCPTGATSATDSDCATMCGNSVVETGETCDTGIASGAGSCPTLASCNDSAACTHDTLAGSACTAMCMNTTITTPMAGDGCCPAGATPTTDSDCMGCGDHVVTPPETCDTAITTGAGSCPTMASCNDGMACTADALVGGGSCSAACTHMPRTAGPMDTCCPTGATIGTDPDCAARCGDGVVTAPEQCDGGPTCTTTCHFATTATAFRFTDLDIRDPHLWASVAGCQDATNRVLGVIDGVNPKIQNAITMDLTTPPDGLLDLSFALVFTPLLQTAGMSTPSYLDNPSCTAPMSSTRCTLAAGAPRTPATAMNMGGTSTCLGTLANTTTAGYTPAIVQPAASMGGTCFVAPAGTVTITFAGIVITLHEASIGGVWSGRPATQITNGLIRGFLSQTDADATIIPAGATGQASIDGHSLGSLLPGGTGNCHVAAPTRGDRDVSAVDGSPGWYFYVNFTATVPMSYTEL